MARKKPTTMTLSQTVLDLINERTRGAEGATSGQVDQDLTRYYTAMENERMGLRNILTHAEISELIVAFTGNIPAIDLLPTEITKAEKEGIVGPKLVEKIQALDWSAQCALIDALETAEKRINKGENLSLGEIL